MPTPDRIHLIAHANPLGPDLARFGLRSVEEYVAFCRRSLARPWRLTCSTKLLKVVEEPWHGGRRDDVARIRDLQDALDDPRTAAIVAASGGAYFSRILPHVDFSGLTGRRAPLWALGFSEMTTLVGNIASYRCGRGLYWLCPNWLGSKIQPPQTAREALAEFWRVLPEILGGQTPGEVQHLDLGPLHGRLVAGRARSGRVRLMGGCLAILAAVTSGPLGRRLRPDGKWLMLEDVRESPYRIDRHLAALKHAGWFERAAGLVLGDFHMLHEDTQPAVLELLPYHLPAKRRLPVVITRAFGHVWPIVPVLLNRALRMDVRGGEVTIGGSV